MDMAERSSLVTDVVVVVEMKQFIVYSGSIHYALPGFVVA